MICIICHLNRRSHRIPKYILRKLKTSEQLLYEVGYRVASNNYTSKEKQLNLIYLTLMKRCFRFCHGHSRKCLWSFFLLSSSRKKKKGSLDMLWLLVHSQTFAANQVKYLHFLRTKGKSNSLFFISVRIDLLVRMASCFAVDGRADGLSIQHKY